MPTVNRGFTCDESMSAALNAFIDEEGFPGFSAAVQHIFYYHLKDRSGEVFRRMREVYEAMLIIRCPASDDTKSAESRKTGHKNRAS